MDLVLYEAGAFQSGYEVSILCNDLMLCCIQELIPELFYLPEMFTNNHRYKLGVQDDDAEVDNVQLPPWASTPEEFVRFHRMVNEHNI